MAFFKKRERAEPEQDNKEKNENDCDDLLISTYLGRKNITREMAEEIPAIQGNLDLIVKQLLMFQYVYTKGMENVLRKLKMITESAC